MTLILYGPSPLIDRLETALRRAGRADVLRLSADHLPETLENLPPGMILYDHTTTDPEGLYHLLTGYPGWQLVGLTRGDDTWTIRCKKLSTGSLGELVTRLHSDSIQET